LEWSGDVGNGEGKRVGNPEGMREWIDISSAKYWISSNTYEENLFHLAISFPAHELFIV
jgi:hypothetical protein